MSLKYNNLKHIAERAIGALRGHADKTVQTAIAELEQELAAPSEGNLAEEGDHKKSGSVPEPEVEEEESSDAKSEEEKTKTGKAATEKEKKIAHKKKK